VTDHLANERTYLAWIRTALGLIGFGFVLARVGVLLRQLTRHAATPAGEPVRPIFQPGGEFLASGVVFLVLGVFMCYWSGRRYGENRRAIDEDRFIAAGRSVVALTSLVVVGGIVITGMVILRLMGAES
jgi:putative membrane protein